MNYHEPNSLVYLKYFPREKNHASDDGKIRPRDSLEGCPQCGKPSILETVSLEYCGQCGYVDVDYWGLIPYGRKTLTRNKNEVDDR